MPPKRKRTLTPKRKSIRPRRSIYGPITRVAITLQDTKNISIAEKSAYGFVYGYTGSLSVNSFYEAIKINADSPADIKLLSARLTVDVMIRPPDPSSLTTSLEPPLQDDRNLPGTSKQPVKPVPPPVTYCACLLVQDHETVDTAKFNSIQHMRCFPGAVSRIAYEPQHVTLKKVWRPTEPSERDWLGHSGLDTKFFQYQIMLSYLGPDGWLTPNNYNIGLKRTFDVGLRFDCVVLIRGKHSSVTISLDSPSTSSAGDGFTVSAVEDEFDCLEMSP